MKIYILLVIAIIATAESGSNSQPNSEYLPPLDDADGSGDSTSIGTDGYEYKTVKRLKYRHRRDVSELPNQEYLPPNAVPNQEYLPPNSQGSAGDSTAIGQDGYQYKTVKRLRYRHRRDVSELPNQEYLPPNTVPNQEYLPPNSQASAGDSTAVGQDGYQYKTVKRLRYRHRRDVSELPSQEYLPPNGVPNNEYLPPFADNESAGGSTPVGKNGYEYKTAKRFRYRLRRH